MQTREISAIAFSRAKPSSFYAVRLAVGFWDDFGVQIYSIPQLACVARTGEMTGLPRSLLIVDFEEGKSTSRRYLVVGQATGRVVAIPFVDKALDLTDKRIITLGDSPVLLTKCCVEGRPTVLATGSRSTLLSWKKDGIFFSPLLLKVCYSALVTSD